MWQLQLLSKSRARIPSCVGSCSRTLCNLHCNTSAIVLFKIKSFTQTHNSLNVMLEVIFVLSYLCIPSYPSISVPESNVCLKYINNNDNIYICYYTLLWHSCFWIQRKVWGIKSKFLIWLLFLGILLSVASSMKTELSFWKQNKEFLKK